MKENNMSYTIEPSSDHKYIVIKTVGDITGTITMEQDIEANKLGAKLGINRYLVDFTEARNVDSIIANYKYAYEDLKQTKGIDLNARVAVLASPNDHSHDFVETVLRNAGLDLKLFRDKEQAIKFLITD